MSTILVKTRARVDADGMIHVQLPEGVHPDEVDVEVTCASVDVDEKQERRRRAAQEGRGMLAGLGLTVADLFEERRHDTSLRDEALGL